MRNERRAEKRAIKLSTEHWERMIEWVEDNIKEGFFTADDRPNRGLMLNNIGEYWSGTYCRLCALYADPFVGCPDCPLSKYYKDCFWDDSEYFQLRNSDTWEQWLTHAKKLLAQLKSLEVR